MSYVVTALGLLALTLSSIAGCPSLGLSDLEGLPAGTERMPPPAASVPDSSGSVRGASFPVSVGPPAAGDTLSAQFPGCRAVPNVALLREQVLELVNREREARGLNPVVRNATLERQAEQYACELITFDFFDHVNPVTGSTLAERAAEFGYSYRVIGENLAAGQTTPQQAMTDWMNSPGHRDNILEPRFTELGIGIRLGGRYGYYWVQEFGQPATR